MTIGDAAMTIGSAGLETTGSGLVGTLIAGGLRVAGMLVLLMLVMLALRGASAATRHAVWRAGFVVALVLPLLAAALPWRLELLPGPVEAVETPAWVSDAAVGTGTERPIVEGPEARPEADVISGRMGRSVEPGTQPAPASVAAPAGVLDGAARRGTMALADLLLWVWLTGAVLLALRLLVGHMAVSRILRAGRRLADPDWTSPLYEAADILDVAVDVDLVSSDRVTMPFTARIRRPAIVLPESAGAWNLERRRAVLMHELAHIRRRDLFSHHVARWVCALHWFNPLAWAGARRMRADSERAADDLVLSAGTRASDYADHLLQIVSGAGRSIMPAPALPLAQRREFEGRMLAILEPGIRRRGPGRLQTAVVTALVLLMTLPLAALDRAEPSRSMLDEAEVSKHDEGVGDPGADGIRDRENSNSNTNRHSNANRNSNTNRDDDTSRDSHRNRDANRGRDTGVATSPAAPLPESFRAGIEPVVPPMPPQPGIVGKIMEDALDRAVDASVPVIEAALAAGVDRAVPALVRALADVDLSVRQAVVYALGETDDPRAVEALVRILLEDAVADVRAAAAWALGEIEDAAAVPGLIRALRDDSSADVRQRAAWALGEIEDERAVQALGAALGDADSEVRHMAMWALGEIESPASVPGLVAGLSSEDPELRGMAAWALGEIEDPAAINGLIRALRDDSSPEVRQLAARALGEIEDPRAVEALAAAVDDSSEEVRQTAMWALAEIESPAAVPALLRALVDGSPRVRVTAAHALGEADLEVAPAALVAALRDANPEVRAAAAHALGEICDPASIQALTAAMHDSNEEVRMAAIHALVEMDSEEAAAAMIELLDHEDPNVRKHAAQALGDS